MSTIPKEIQDKIKNDAKEFCRKPLNPDVIISHEEYSLAGLVAYHEAAEKYYQLATDGREELEKENARLNELVRTSAKEFNESVTTLNGIFESKITALQSSLKEKEKECEELKSQKARAEISNEGVSLELEWKSKQIEELKAENERLQKIVDIVNDRPDL